MKPLYPHIKKIAIGSDHAGFEYKEIIANELTHQNLTIQDFGTFNTTSVDYPDFAHLVAQAVQNNEASFGILICGSGNGVAITANKHKNIRAALCWTTAIAMLARQHNNANIICIPARFVDITTAQDMVEIFLQTPFESGRHQKRVDKIESIR
ncbi:MAG TPA: ribose 5-phosphate isomerase B [Chitinophagaceae bacterium]|nr:ribose 5-phosphate isomerase B [Chitinophagaceae bacterium]